MAFLDSLTGGAYDRAWKGSMQAINAGMTQGTTALGDNYTAANNTLTGQALPALVAGYTNASPFIQMGYGNQRTDLAAGYGSGMDALSGQYANALGSLGQGRSDLLSQYGQARGDITENYDRARSDLGTQYRETQGYLGQATDAYTPMIQGSQGAFTGLMDATGANGAAGSARATANFRAAPGYQYQQDQALGALQRTAAARGGLAGGNLTADILNTATGLADQSYQQYINNLNTGAGYYNQGVQGRAAALTNQGNASQNYGTALGNLGMRQGDQLAGISTRLGDQLAGLDKTSAGIYTGLGDQLGNLNVGLGTSLGASDVGQGTALGNLSIGSGNGQSGIYGNVATNYTNLGNQEANLIQNMTNAMTNANNTRAQDQTAASSNLFGTIAGIANSPLTGKIFGGLFG